MLLPAPSRQTYDCSLNGSPDARARAVQLLASAEDPDRPVSAEARAALITLDEDSTAALSAETRLERLEAQLTRVEYMWLVLLDRVHMR